jgi:hypothetical protein
MGKVPICCEICFKPLKNLKVNAKKSKLIFIRLSENKPVEI